MKSSVHSIELKDWNLAGCNIWNSLHETNVIYESLSSIKSQAYYYHATYCSCTYVVNSVYEYLVETDSHLQISQRQASLKHENFTVSYYNYITILPQNILKLQLHFICTFYSINNLRFTKIRASWNGELPPQVPNFLKFLTPPKFERGCFNWPKFYLGSCNCPNVYNTCKSEWNSSNLPRWFQLFPTLNEAVSIT